MTSTAAKKLSPKVAAAMFVELCRSEGWGITIKSETIVAISKHFAPNDTDAFLNCDMSYYHVLTTLPARGGSIWGTDGGSVGGHVAMTHGQFIMNQSGVSKAAVREVAKILGIWHWA